MDAPTLDSRLARFLLGLTALALGACHERSAQSAPRERVYVSNEDASTVSVIDAATDRVIDVIHVGKRPRGVRLSPDGRTLYVALSGSPKAGPGVDEATLPARDAAADGIGVIDVASNTLVRVLPSGRDPELFDVTPDGRFAYVSNEETAETSVLDLAAGQVVRTIPVGGEPEGVTARPDGKVVYVTSERGDEVTVIDTASRAVVATIETGSRPRAVAFTPDGARAYVTEELGGSVSVVDARDHRVIDQIKIPRVGSGPTPPRPMGVRVSPDGTIVYVTNGRNRTLSMIDVATNRVTRTIEDVANRPWGVDVTRDGKKLYVAGGDSDDVAVIDAASGRTLARIPAGKSPWGVVVTR